MNLFGSLFYERNIFLANLSTKPSSNKENTDRLDMPPPPSPASSTCSDTGSISTSHSKF